MLKSHLNIFWLVDFLLMRCCLSLDQTELLKLPAKHDGLLHNRPVCVCAPFSFFVCLSDAITSRFRIKALYIIPGSRQTPHIIYCWAVDDVSCHLAMSVTHTKTNTKTNTQTKTNTKCFKDPMYVGVMYVIFFF